MRARGRFLQVTTAVTATMMLLTSSFGGRGGDGQGSSTMDWRRVPAS